MIFVVPCDPPPTFPEPSTVAIDPAVLIHVPPPITSVNPVVEPWHTTKVPSMGPGALFTVTGIDVEHEVG